ncbi:prolyl oligopeptidase family serine peptidase [Methylobacterium sp. 1973]|uniref:alpha/beta hydrolase family protein n=1 Tax=Methylobacterium sp. 1973 TaxID=3156421 RepID=UPI0033947F1D
MIRAIGDPDTAAGLDLMRARSPVHRAGGIRAPLLIAQSATAPRVKQAESDQRVAALDAKRLTVNDPLFPDEGHGFVRPENRLALYARAEAILARHLGGHAESPRTRRPRRAVPRRSCATADAQSSICPRL